MRTTAPESASPRRLCGRLRERDLEPLGAAIAEQFEPDDLARSLRVEDEREVLDLVRRPSVRREKNVADGVAIARLRDAAHSGSSRGAARLDVGDQEPLG